MELRIARAISKTPQWKLRIKTGINQTKISLIENGYVEPNDHEKTAIARALGFEVRDIDWAKSAKDSVG